MRKILDKMFENKKLSQTASLAAALLMYLLFILFGTAEDKRSYMVALPVISGILFGGVYVGMRIQKNLSFVLLWDFVELLAAVAFPIYSTAYGIAFIASGFQSFNPGCILGFVCHGAIALAHNGEA